MQSCIILYQVNTTHLQSSGINFFLDGHKVVIELHVAQIQIN